jgi:hypothetical protein
MKRTQTFVLVAMAVATIAGCANRPRIFSPPGSTTYQRYHATLHDPYPDIDLGPEVVGGRPREFAKPLPEPVRNRWLRDLWWSK